MAYVTTYKLSICQDCLLIIMTLHQDSVQQNQVPNAQSARSHYHVNHNMPGYLPEADGFHTEDWSEALSALQDEIKSFQDDWSEYCEEQHSTEEEYQDCANGGANRCDWQEVWVSAEADLVGLKEAGITDGEEWGVIYSTPEGADVSLWLRGCSEAYCVMTCDEV